MTAVGFIYLHDISLRYIGQAPRLRTRRNGNAARMSSGKRWLVVAPAVTAFVWWLLKHGPDVDAWTIDRER